MLLVLGSLCSLPLSWIPWVWDCLVSCLFWNSIPWLLQDQSLVLDCLIPQTLQSQCLGFGIALSLTHLELNLLAHLEVILLALGLLNPLLLLTSVPWLPQSQCFFFGIVGSLGPFWSQSHGPFFIQSFVFGFPQFFPLFRGRFFLSGAAQSLGPFWTQFHGPFNLKAFSLGLGNPFNLSPFNLNSMGWDSSILYPFSTQFLCTFSLNAFLVFGMVPWPLQSQSLVCGISCVFELSPSIFLNSIPCFWDSSFLFPFLDQSLLLGMTEFLTPLDCIPMYFWGLMSQSLTYFKLKPLFLGFFNPLSFFRSGLWPPQSQYFVFGIVGSLGPFFWFQDGSIPIFSLILGLFNPSASLSSIPWPLLSTIPWFWDCSIPLTSSTSMPWFWDCSIFLSLWNSILWPLQSQCFLFGIAQSLLL